MELTKCKLGELITQRREKNDGSDLPICGVSKDGLIPPKQKDADTSIYNVFYRDDFIFNPARMELNSIAINDMYDRAICSSLYEVFYVIDYEEKAFYDILKAVSKKFEFEYPDDKMIELSKRIKLIVDDKSRYTDWSARDDIKANLQVDLILLLDEFGYPPVTIDDVYKEVLEQAENFKKYAQ